MSTVNRIFNLGRLTQDPDFKTTSGGTSLCRLSIATNHKYKDKETVCFLEWTLWGTTADNAAKYLRKGDLVHLEGRLDLQTWDDQNGQKQRKHVAVCERMTFMPNGKKDNAANPASSRTDDQYPQPTNASGDFPDDDIPF